MKKLVSLLLAVIFCAGFAARPAQAEEIELQRGEEQEMELILEGAEDAYSVLGELEYPPRIKMPFGRKFENFFPASHLLPKNSTPYLVATAKGKT